MSFRDALRARAAGARRAASSSPKGPIRACRPPRRQLARLGIAEPILLGRQASIRPATTGCRRSAKLLRNGVPAWFATRRTRCDLAADPLRFAAGLVALGEADGCVAGAVVTTADVVRAALWLIGMAAGSGSR